MGRIPGAEDGKGRLTDVVFCVKMGMHLDSVLISRYHTSALFSKDADLVFDEIRSRKTWSDEQLELKFPRRWVRQKNSWRLIVSEMLSYIFWEASYFILFT
jgi:hypothetical protein